MTMVDECDVSKIVTNFLLNTCRLPPRISSCDMQAALCCIELTTLQPAEDEEAAFIPMTTGSVAEFYIKPMLPHVGDIDVMFYQNIELAIPRGHPPQTQLPAEFHNYVKVYEIIDSHLPGYVYLPLRYLLTQCVDDGKYNYIEVQEEVYLGYPDTDGNASNRHGPADFRDLSQCVRLSHDAVYCVRCLVWPLQAADWPTRHRNYGRPDSATLDRVVNNGCDVVCVAHRLCRQDEWMGERQHRLSFSRAEIVLINCWMPLQQIVYHMLRHFIKIERLTDCADNSESGTLSNYHIKTLMLWASELKSRSWWTENLNLVRICVELLQTLSVWLTDMRCAHYFANNCNLLDNSYVRSVASKLLPINEEFLSSWLINNYIAQCAQMCPVRISRLFNDVNTVTKLQNIVSEIVWWRLNNSLCYMWDAVNFAESAITVEMRHFPVTARSYVFAMNEFAKIDQNFCIYFSAVALLHIASKLSRNGYKDELVDILSIIFSNLPLHETELNTSELVELLQKSAVELLTTYRQLIAPDFGSVATIVTTDFEAMYAYKRGDYQRCLQLSTQNVHTLWYTVYIHSIPISPEFIQLLDDDIVSLTALTLIVNPKCRIGTGMHNGCITQLTLSLYLMTQCKLKLGRTVESLVYTLHYIKVAQKRHPTSRLNQLTLKLIESKVRRALLIPKVNYSN